MTLANGASRVAIVEDNDLLAESLAMALRRPDLDPHVVPLNGRGGDSLLDRVLVLEPCIALLDLHLGADGDGGRLIGPLTAQGVGVVVLTAATDAARHGQCFADGARAVLEKSSSLDTILSVLRAVADDARGTAPAHTPHG